jgi:glutathione S-transferase
VVNRLHVYDVDVSAPTRSYMHRMMALPAWQDWAAQAQAEPRVIDKYEID